MVLVNGKNTVMLYRVMKHVCDGALVILNKKSSCSVASDVQTTQSPQPTELFMHWFLAMTLALAGPGSLLLTSLSILYLLQCFLLIAGKEQSMLIAAASQTN
jgi:hypothetical protein